MIQSMTGFGAMEQDGWRVEIRSVNHRFLDVFVKAPSSLGQHEMTFRSMVRERFSRGRFDVTISLADEEGAEISVRKNVASMIYSSLKGLKEELAIPGDVDIATLAGMHELFLEAGSRSSIDLIRDTFGKAVENLHAMRCREGQALSEDLGSVLGVLEGLNLRIRGLCTECIPRLAEKLRERLRALLADADVDEGRLIQEAAIAAMKMDISEEVARIESHIGQFRTILREGGVVGRKLDFIVQELHREVNTLAAKASDYDITRCAVDMKAEIEKLKEQVQNIQ